MMAAGVSECVLKQQETRNKKLPTIFPRFFYQKRRRRPDAIGKKELVYLFVFHIKLTLDGERAGGGIGDFYSVYEDTLFVHVLLLL